MDPLLQFYKAWFPDNDLWQILRDGEVHGNRVAWERKHLQADMGATEAIVVSFSITPFWSLIFRNFDDYYLCIFIAV